MSWSIDIDTSNGDGTEYNLYDIFDFKSIIFLEDTLKIHSNNKTLKKGEDYILKKSENELKIVFDELIQKGIYNIRFKTSMVEL